MYRVLCLGLCLGLAGCAKLSEEKSAQAQRGPVRLTTRIEPFRRPPSTTPVPTAKAVVPDPPEDPPREKPRTRPSALQKEVDDYLAEPPIHLSAPELLKGYENEAEGDKKFKERKVWLTGYVMRTGRGGLGIPYVELAPGKEGGLVRCFLDKRRGLTVDELKENQEVTIEGHVASKGANQEIRVGDCRILPRANVLAIMEEAKRQKD
jgi:hypothetical protein